MSLQASQPSACVRSPGQQLDPCAGCALCVGSCRCRCGIFPSCLCSHRSPQHVLEKQYVVSPWRSMWTMVGVSCGAVVRDIDAGSRRLHHTLLSLGSRWCHMLLYSAYSPAGSASASTLPFCKAWGLVMLQNVQGSRHTRSCKVCTVQQNGQGLCTKAQRTSRQAGSA